jgi:hypothetical protein
MVYWLLVGDQHLVQYRTGLTVAVVFTTTDGLSRALSAVPDEHIHIELQLQLETIARVLVGFDATTSASWANSIDKGNRWDGTTPTDAR